MNKKGNASAGIIVGLIILIIIVITSIMIYNSQWEDIKSTANEKLNINEVAKEFGISLHDKNERIVKFDPVGELPSDIVKYTNQIVNQIFSNDGKNIKIYSYFDAEKFKKYGILFEEGSNNGKHGINIYIVDQSNNYFLFEGFEKSLRLENKALGVMKSGHIKNENNANVESLGVHWILSNYCKKGYAGYDDGILEFPNMNKIIKNFQSSKKYKEGIYMDSYVQPVMNIMISPESVSDNEIGPNEYRLPELSWETKKLKDDKIPNKNIYEKMKTYIKKGHLAVISNADDTKKLNKLIGVETPMLAESYVVFFPSIMVRGSTAFHKVNTNKLKQGKTAVLRDPDSGTIIQKEDGKLVAEGVGYLHDVSVTNIIDNIDLCK